MPYYREKARDILFREAVMAFLLGENYRPYRVTVKKKVVVGHYCSGKYVRACRNTFGNALEKVCSTCPD